MKYLWLIVLFLAACAESESSLVKIDSCRNDTIKRFFYGYGEYCEADDETIQDGEVPSQRLWVLISERCDPEHELPDQPTVNYCNRVSENCDPQQQRFKNGDIVPTRWWRDVIITAAYYKKETP